MINQTLEYYNNNFDNFVKSTINADVSSLYGMFLKYLPPNARILDLGCGSGRDSKAFLDMGYSVISIDGSRALCDYATEFTGQEVVCMDFKDITYTNEFDGVWACASLLHLPVEELSVVFEKIINSMKGNAIWYVSFKYGTASKIRDGRYYTDLTEEKLEELLAPFSPKISFLELRTTLDVRPSRNSEKWLSATLRKDSLS